MSCIHGPKNQSWPQYFETYEVIGAITSFMERCLHLYLCLFVLYDSLAFFIPRSILKCIERSSRMRTVALDPLFALSLIQVLNPNRKWKSVSIRCAIARFAKNSSPASTYSTVQHNKLKAQAKQASRNRKMTHHFCSVLLLIKKNIRLNHDRRRCRQKRSNQPAS